MLLFFLVMIIFFGKSITSRLVIVTPYLFIIYAVYLFCKSVESGHNFNNNPIMPCIPQKKAASDQCLHCLH